jgi:hypothetical protein
MSRRPRRNHSPNVKAKVALNALRAGQGDTFKQALFQARRISVVTHTTLRMQSDAPSALDTHANRANGLLGKACIACDPAKAG